MEPGLSGRRLRRVLRHPALPPACGVAVATLVAVWCAAQPHTPFSRLGLGVAVSIGTASAGVAWWRGGGVSFGAVFGLALALRIAALPLGPTLSDDGYRYVWDGLVQAQGVNPYERLPTDAGLDPLRERVPFDRLNSPRYYSVYPPASQLVFRAAVWIAGPDANWTEVWHVIKALMLGFEVLALVLLSRLVTARAATLYAWHPLPVLEIAGQGHTEAAMLPALLAAVLLLRPAVPSAWGRAGAGAALAWATMVKLVPALLAPLVLRQARGWAVVGGALGGLALALPYAAPYVVPNVRSSLDLYVGYFEFNAGPYYLLKEIGQWWTGEDVSKALGPALRTAFVLGIPALAVVAWRRRWAAATALLVGWSWFLVTSTTVHPWYLLAPLALLPAVVERDAAGRRQVIAWGALAAGSGFTYALYADVGLLYWVAVIASWSAWFLLQSATVAAHSLPRLMDYRGGSKWTWIGRHLGPIGSTSRVLDLGAGEGYVGQAAAGSTDAEVILCDVADFNRTDLPHTRYDGHTLPFDSETADVVLLVFVLHHAEDAERVLAEAYRVLRPDGQVAVLESVAESEGDDRVLHALDPLANRIRSGGLMDEQEEHLRFRSTAAWREAFEAAGFRVLREDRRGRMLHKQHLFILEKH